VNPIINGGPVDLCVECNERTYYFDWHNQIDNPETTLHHVFSHIERIMQSEAVMVPHYEGALLVDARNAICDALREVERCE